jgi:choline dehydrogenase
MYDYIVVGSGPGGSTVATRLALNNFKVLLIEAGPDYDDGVTRTPIFWPINQLNPKIIANFNPYLYSEEDKKTIEYPRGITLGGSAQINVMVAMKANPSEWDHIEQITGDSNWNQEIIKNKYQTLTEKCQYCTNGDDNENKDGWLNTSIAANREPLQLTEINPVLDDLLKNVKSEYRFNPNVNKENFYDSYFYTPESITEETGQRGSTYRRIKNIQSMKNSNLYVWADTFVTKLIIDPKTKEACGVEYVQGSHLYKASSLASSSSNSHSFKKSSIYAKREIIVSGGQWMTPQLLQLSGIGDQNLLKQFGIDIIQDLPGVGVNQQDRSEATYVVKLKKDVNIAGKRAEGCTFNTTPVDPCLIDYIKNPKTNYYSSNGGLFAMFRSTQPKQPNFPDTALVFLSVRFTGFRKDWVTESLQYPVGTYLSVIVNLARVQNDLGTVRIQSTNAFDTPLIQLNHFKGANKQTEINRLIENIRYLRKLLIDSPFSQYIDFEELPGRNLQTDEQLSEFIQEYVWGHHACCTAKMGNTKTDPLAVLNSKAQVKGIKNLRVCDISIFPKIPGYYPFMSVITACEKIADDIIKQARY